MTPLTREPYDRLYGLVVHQTYRYFKLYPKDSGWIKALVRTRPTNPE